MYQEISEAVNTVVFHYKAGNINWPLAIYVTLVHVAGCIGLTYLTSCHKYTLLLAFSLWPISSFGITAGSHRLWAHRSYKASLPVRIFLMLAASLANQGSIWHWARDHRVHHKYSETDADPHNATRGFFFAHIGWLYLKKSKNVTEAGKKLDFSDLANDPVVMFQKNADPWFAQFICFVMPGLLCMLWGDSFWHGYWVAGAVRSVFMWHNTWFVNSAAHLWGDHPYDPQSYPAENPVVAFLAMGEGWHNWHHKYPFDYAASEFGVSYQFNPTKLLIDIWCLLGLASDRKRATGAWAKLRAQREADIYGAEGDKTLATKLKAR